MIASDAPVADVWKRALAQVRTRLHLTLIKTTDALQRVELARSIVLPKLRFIARHTWPTATVLKQLQSFITNFVWHGKLTSTGGGGRAWMSLAAAALPLRDGGLGVPDLRLAILRDAHNAVIRWTTSTNSVTSAVGFIMLSTASAAGSHWTGGTRHVGGKDRIGRTLATTGLRQLRTSTTQARTDTELRYLATLLLHCGKGTTTEKHWRRDRLCCDYSRLKTSLDALAEHQHAVFGQFSPGALLASQVFGADVLRVTPTRRLRWKDIPGIVPRGATIGDVVEIERESLTVLLFRCKTVAYPLPPREATALKSFCDALVMNYPALRWQHDPPDVLRPRPHSDDVWRVRHASDGIHLIREFSPSTREDLRVVRSLAEAARTAERTMLLSRVSISTPSSTSVPAYGRRSLCIPRSRRRRASHRRYELYKHVCMKRLPEMRRSGRP